MTFKLLDVQTIHDSSKCGSDVKFTVTTSKAKEPAVSIQQPTLSTSPARPSPHPPFSPPETPTHPQPSFLLHLPSTAIQALADAHPLATTNVILPQRTRLHGMFHRAHLQPIPQRRLSKLRSHHRSPKLPRSNRRPDLSGFRRPSHSRRPLSIMGS